MTSIPEICKVRRTSVPTLLESGLQNQSKECFISREKRYYLNLENNFLFIIFFSSSLVFLPLTYFALSLSFLITYICPDNVIKTFGKKQEAMQKMMEEEREEHRKAAEQPPAKKEPEQKEKPEAEVQEQKEAPKEEKSNKPFPLSPLFKDWGENLSEEEQREAEGLFQKYGYNVFLSDRLPLDRVLPDTRDPR